MNQKISTVACLGIKFDPQKSVNEFTQNFPKDTKFLSCIEVCKDNRHFLQLHYMYSDMSETKCFEFIIAKFCFTEIHISGHKYLGTVSVEDETFAVFCK